MPRQPRRNPPHGEPATTPTRPPTTTNALATGIPPVMLQTPPHAPFLTNPTAYADTRPSILPADPPPPHNLRQYQTPNHMPPPDPSPSTFPPNPPPDAPISATSPTTSDSQFSSSIPHDPDDTRALLGLRDICSLATWTLSSSKPGCALPQLRHPSPSHFWQSDGPQPHTLTLHFFKLVAIVKMRVYLDFVLDESYTPTRIKFFAGMSEGGLVEFASWEVQESIDPETGEVTSGVEGVQGWIDISLVGVGGRDTSYRDLDLRFDEEGGEMSPQNRPGPTRRDQKPDSRPFVLSTSAARPEEDAMLTATGGDVLKCMVLQVRICENHQNGKDTHVRGFQVFSRDENAGKGSRQVIKKAALPDRGDGAAEDHEGMKEMEVLGMEEADWMGEPEIR